MQYVTPALMNETKRQGGFWRFLRKASAKDAYYQAESPDGGVYLLWVESFRLDQLQTFPSVLRQGERLYVFESLRDRSVRQKQKEMVTLWKQVVSPRTIRSEYRVVRLSEEEFDRLYAQYLQEYRQMGRHPEVPAEALPSAE